MKIKNKEIKNKARYITYLRNKIKKILKEAQREKIELTSVITDQKKEILKILILCASYKAETKLLERRLKESSEEYPNCPVCYARSKFPILYPERFCKLCGKEK